MPRKSKQKKSTKLKAIRRGGSKVHWDAEEAGIAFIGRSRLFKREVDELRNRLRPVMARDISEFTESDVDGIDELYNKSVEILQDDINSILDSVFEVENKLDTTINRLQHKMLGGPDGIYYAEKSDHLQKMFDTIHADAAKLEAMRDALIPVLERIKERRSAIILNVMQRGVHSPRPTWAVEGSYPHTAVVMAREEMEARHAAVITLHGRLEQIQDMTNLTVKERTSRDIFRQVSEIMAEIVATKMRANTPSWVVSNSLTQQMEMYVRPIAVKISEVIKKMRAMSDSKRSTDTVAPPENAVQMTMSNDLFKIVMGMDSRVAARCAASLRKDLESSFAAWILNNIETYIDAVKAINMASDDQIRAFSKALDSASMRTRVTVGGQLVLRSKEEVIREDIKEILPPGIDTQLSKNLERSMELGKNSKMDCLRLAVMLTIMDNVSISRNFMWHALRGNKIGIATDIRLLVPEVYPVLDKGTTASKSTVTSTFWSMIKTQLDLSNLKATLPLDGGSLVQREKVSSLATNIYRLSDILKRTLAKNGINKKNRLQLPCEQATSGVSSNGGYVVFDEEDVRVCFDWTTLMSLLDEEEIDEITRNLPASEKAPEWLRRVVAVYFTPTDSDKKKMEDLALRVEKEDDLF